MGSASKAVTNWKMNCLARAILDGARRFYSDPENVRRFEEWKNSAEGQAYIRRHQQTEEVGE